MHLQKYYMEIRQDIHIIILRLRGTKGIIFT